MKTASSVVNVLLDSEDELSPEEVQGFIDQAVNTPPYVAKYLAFKAGTGPYGSGGWSRNAKHRPQPTVVTKLANSIKYSAGSRFWNIDGINKRKVNIWKSNGEPIEISYPDIKFDS